MLHQIMNKLTNEVISKPLDFQVGDQLKVHYKIKEGNKERIQVYEGLVTAIQNSGTGKTFTVRRVSFDVGVERIFPLYSPTVAKIEKLRSNKIRRAKLYYLREKTGKSSRLKEVRRPVPVDKVFERAQEYKKSVVKAEPAPVAENAPQ